MKFLTWFESNYRTLITKTKGETIGRYKDFLTNGGRAYSAS